MVSHSSWMLLLLTGIEKLLIYQQIIFSLLAFKVTGRIKHELKAKGELQWSYWEIQTHNGILSPMSFNLGRFCKTWRLKRRDTDEQISIRCAKLHIWLINPKSGSAYVHWKTYSPNSHSPSVGKKVIRHYWVLVWGLDPLSSPQMA